MGSIGKLISIDYFTYIKNMKEKVSLKPIEKAIRSYLESFSIVPEINNCDHLCYIVKEESKFEEWKKAAPEIGFILREFDGAARNLSNSRFLIIKIKEPLIFMEYKVSILEIKFTDFPEFEEGWQHAEFIPKDSLETIVTTNPGIPFETGRINDPDNAEIGVRITKQYSLKFRTDSLENQNWR